MRKGLLISTVAGALAIAVASIAVAATGARCGTRYTKACTPPKFTVVLSPGCRKAGSSVSLPSTTFTSIAGIRSIAVSFAGRSLKTLSFTGRGPQQYTLKGVSIATTGFKPGIYPVTVTIKDVKGKVSTRTVRFSVCRPKPIFTG